MASLLPEILFEISGQAPSPSKDYHHLTVTKTEVIWRWWKISLNVKQISFPGESKESHDVFLNNSGLQQHVGLVFGSHILEYTLGLCKGRFDYLERLSDKLLLRILSYLRDQDICHLSQTSHRFKKLCDSEELWEQAMRRCGTDLTPEIKRMAIMCGWKRIYSTMYHHTPQHISEVDQHEDKVEPHESL